MKRILTIRMRPFQPLLLGGDDLLDVALPFHKEVLANGKRFQETGVEEPLTGDTWRKEKSLSMGSFLLKYAGLEALVNCHRSD